MPPLKSPGLDLKERTTYKFARGTRGIRIIDSREPDAFVGVEASNSVPLDAGLLEREGKTLRWFDRLQYYGEHYQVPLPGERSNTLEIAREKYPGYNHIERRG